jgi:hypothetical protein
VELGDGVMRKLPFDDGASYLDAADKFLTRENLPKMHLATVIKHLKQNSKQVETPSKVSYPKGVPQKEHVFFDSNVNIQGASKKLKEFNQDLNKNL